MHFPGFDINTCMYFDFEILLMPRFIFNMLTNQILNVQIKIWKHEHIRDRRLKGSLTDYTDVLMSYRKYTWS